MLDESTSALLKFFNEEGRVGAYKIFTLDDFSSALGKELGELAVDKILGDLQENGYLAVKYSGGGMYCVGLLHRGATYLGIEEQKRQEEQKRLGAFESFSFFGAFLGGVVGGFISVAIALLVSLLLKR